MTSAYSRTKLIDFAVLAFRWYLAYYMVSYGIGKIIGEQFGLYDTSILEKPLKEVTRFQLAWYLFSLGKAFNIGVGIAQITGAILIVINRTVLIGALILLPVLVSIFLIDVSFTTGVFGAILPVRLACMILSDLLILLYYKDKVIAAIHLLTKNTSNGYRYPWWLFLLMPVVGLLMDFVWTILSRPLAILIDWSTAI